MSNENNDTPKKDKPTLKRTPRVAINIRMPEDLLEKLRAEALTKDCGFSSIIVQLVRKHYNDKADE